MANRQTLMKAYQAMRKRYGHRQWWPGRTRFEIILGAILTQNAAWKNVEKALQALRASQSLSLKALRAMPEEQLAERIRPAGYYNQKARKIKAFITYLDTHHGGNVSRMFRTETITLRDQLLSVHGIGPETADSILLYAGGHRSFVIDTYTYRIVTRHGWQPFEADYARLKRFFEERLPPDLDLYNDYHAQLVAVGHHHCRKTPKCEGCPLQPLLPNGQPLQPPSKP